MTTTSYHHQVCNVNIDDDDVDTIAKLFEYAISVLSTAQDEALMFMGSYLVELLALPGGNHPQILPLLVIRICVCMVIVNMSCCRTRRVEV